MARKLAATQNPRSETETSSVGTLKSDAPTDKTLTKGLQLLEALSENDHPRGISEIAAELDLTKSNVHRLMQTLVKTGYVAKDERTEKYFLSPKLWRLARPQRQYAALRNLVRPTLEKLTSVTNEAATFAVVEREEVVIIDQLDTENSQRIFFTPGQTLPIDEIVLRGRSLTAFQMLTLSTWPEADASQAIAKIARQLAKPPGFVEDRMNELVKIRVEGYAISEGAWNPDIKAVAAPVYNRYDKLFGILMTFGPADRLEPSAFANAKLVTKEYAERVTVALCKD
ncbi:IclR family transcriptional regulator [Agrobacterium salinitolerans]